MPSAPDTIDPSAAATLLGTADADAHREPATSEHDPARLGRYVVVRRLGAGAMGSVYEGRDVDLDRPVALKLVRADLSLGARQRMHREALALARLSHPNVVQIHEIEQADDDRTFIAMELVRGRTLEAWQRSSPRPGWRQVLRHYAQAGEGLAAAHAEGLVHRDFKPSNCMLGEDGRVRVLDFGLAKHTDDEPDDVTLASGELDGPALPLTRTGAVVGTPAYMPPEQLGRGAVDATANQFSFCVSLYEALYGERPFAGRTLGELLYAVTLGRVRAPAREAVVPGWVRKVVLRGLGAEPGARWPSMRALLDALADDPAVRRRKRWGAAGVVVLLGAGALGMAAVLREQAQQCQGAEVRLGGIWDPERRAAVEQAILGTALPYAPQTWERVQVHLDGYAQAWASAHTAACEASRQGEQSAALLNRRMACLYERRLHLRAQVEELSRADDGAVERAVQAVLELPVIDRCADAEALLAQVPPPEDPTVAQRVVALEDRLVQVDAKRRTGAYAEALALVEAVVTEAEAIGYEPLAARAWLAQGSLQSSEGDYAAAAASLERGYDAAVAQRMTEQAAEASSLLVWVVGAQLDRHEDAFRWAVDADPLSRAVGRPAQRGRYLGNLGTAAWSAGDQARARDCYERALAIHEQVLGPRSPTVAVSLYSLGNTAWAAGEHAQAREWYERSLAIDEEVLGPMHPRVAVVLSALGNVWASDGEHARARALLERALAIQEQALGLDHPDVATTLTNLGKVAQVEGDAAAAREYIERALAIEESALGPDHPALGDTLTNLGRLATGRREHALARDCLERALAIEERALGPAHPTVANTLGSLGSLAVDMGEPVLAREYLERALAIEERALGSTHVELVGTLSSLGGLGYARGEHGRAREHLERALSIAERAFRPDHPQIAALLVNLSTVDVQEGELGRARARLERALAINTKLGPDHPAVAIVLVNLGEVANAEGKHGEALEALERALGILTRVHGPEHPHVAAATAGLGDALVGLGRAAEAIPRLEHALSLRSAGGSEVGELAPLRFALARARWDAPVERGRDRVHARALARLARAAFAREGPGEARSLAAVDAWLASHRAP